MEVFNERFQGLLRWRVEFDTANLGTSAEALVDIYPPCCISRSKSEEMCCGNGRYGNVQPDTFFTSPGASAFLVTYILNDFVSYSCQYVASSLWTFRSADISANWHKEVVILDFGKRGTTHCGGNTYKRPVLIPLPRTTFQSLHTPPQTMAHDESHLT